MAMRRMKFKEFSSFLGSKLGITSRFGHMGPLEADSNVVPAGGTTGQVLAKASGDDFDTTWVAQDGKVVPAGGTIGQTMVKASGDDYDVEWASSVVPNGGTTGQILVKASNTNYDVEWADVGYIKATYDFAVDGGTVGDITLVSAPTIPDNAIITHVVYDVVTELTSTSNDGTIKFKMGTDGDLTDNLTASAGVELGIYEGKPGNFALDGNALTAANMALAKKATYIKLTAARKPQVEIGTHDITAGKINCYIWYVVSE